MYYFMNPNKTHRSLRTKIYSTIKNLVTQTLVTVPLVWHRSLPIAPKNLYRKATPIDQDTALTERTCIRVILPIPCLRFAVLLGAKEGLAL